MATPLPQTPATLSLSQLRLAQAQMAFDRYDFGAPVRVIRRGFVDYGDFVQAEVEFQNEHGMFDGGPRGGFSVGFEAGKYEISDALAQIYGSQIGHMPGEKLHEFDMRLEEGVEMLDIEGVELVERWLEARDEAKGFILGVRIGDARSVHNLTNHPVIDAEKAIAEAITEQRGGLSVLITGQRADRVRDAVLDRRVAIEAAKKAETGFRPI